MTFAKIPINDIGGAGELAGYRLAVAKEDLEAALRKTRHAGDYDDFL